MSIPGSASPQASALNRILITSTYRALLRSAVRIDNNPALRVSLLSLSFLSDAQAATTTKSSLPGTSPSNNPLTSKTNKGSPFVGASLEDFLVELNSGTEMFLLNPEIPATLEPINDNTFVSSSASPGSNMASSDYYVYHFLRKHIGMLRKPLPVAALRSANEVEGSSATSIAKSGSKKERKSGKGSNPPQGEVPYDLSPSFAHYVALGVRPSSMILKGSESIDPQRKSVHFIPPETVSFLRFIFRTLPFSVQQLNVSFSIVKYVAFLGKIINGARKDIYLLPDVFPQQPLRPPEAVHALTRVGRAGYEIDSLLASNGVCYFNVLPNTDATAPNSVLVTPVGISSAQSNFSRFGGIKVRPVVVPNHTNSPFSKEDKGDDATAPKKQQNTTATGVVVEAASPSVDDKGAAANDASTDAEGDSSSDNAIGMQMLVAHPLMLDYFANSIIIMGFIQKFSFQGALNRRFRSQALKKKEFGLKLGKIAKSNPELAEELKKISARIDSSQGGMGGAPAEEADDLVASSKKSLSGLCVGFVINKPFCGPDGMPLPVWSVVPITDPAAHPASATSAALSDALNDEGTNKKGTSARHPDDENSAGINKLFSKYLHNNIVFLGGPVMGPDTHFTIVAPHEGDEPGNEAAPQTKRAPTGSNSQNALFLLHKFSSVRGASRIAGSGSNPSEGLYLSGNFNDLCEIFERGEAKAEDVMVILGYSSWGEGQLDNEIRKMGSWVTLERKVEFAVEQQQQQPHSTKAHTQPSVMTNAEFVLSYNRVATNYDTLLPRPGSFSSSATIHSHKHGSPPGAPSSEDGLISSVLPAEAPEIISGDALVTRQRSESAPYIHWKELMNSLGLQYRYMSAVGTVDVFNGMVRSYFKAGSL